MNDAPDQFEQRLRRQPLREIPNKWRGEILAAAKPATRTSPRTWFLSTFNHQCSTLFWPHPKAWAGLAAAWIVIFTLHLCTHDESPVVGKKSRVSPEVMAEVRQQQLFFAELAGGNNAREAEPPKFILPRPRSERGYITPVV
jgi:hypothetical protein